MAITANCQLGAAIGRIDSKLDKQGAVIQCRTVRNSAGYSAQRVAAVRIPRATGKNIAGSQTGRGSRRGRRAMPEVDPDSWEERARRLRIELRHAMYIPVCQEAATLLDELIGELERMRAEQCQLYLYTGLARDE